MSSKPDKNYWLNRNVVVLGGASFIGSHLVEQLVDLKAKVTVADNLSTGKLSFLKNIMDRIVFLNYDLRDLNQASDAIRSKDTVFHLAAVHGGREFIFNKPADVCQSLQINENVFRKCVEHKVKKVIFSSSVCVYPTDIQIEGIIPVKEEQVKNDEGWYKPDDMYGWTKLTAEKSLQAYHKQYGLKSAILRYTTVYGPRLNATHAVTALIQRALRKEDPFLVWGSGSQGRDFIYVDDVCKGTIIAAEKVSDAVAVNLVGTTMYKITEILMMIFKHLKWRPKKIIFDTNKPEGPKARYISWDKAKSLLDFEAEMEFEAGLIKTIDYIKANYG